MGQSISEDPDRNHDHEKSGRPRYLSQYASHGNSLPHVVVNVKKVDQNA